MVKVVKENIQTPLNWAQILKYLYRILIIGSCRSGKINFIKNWLLNLIKQQDDDDYSIIDKILKIHTKKNLNILLKNAKIMVLKIW